MPPLNTSSPVPQHGEPCAHCGYRHTSSTCPTDDQVVAWHDSQAEETLAALPGYDDGLTPRQAWNAFFCSPPAANTAASLPAPAAGQGEGIVWRTHCPQCGELLSVADEPYCAYLGCFWNNEQ